MNMISRHPLGHLVAPHQDWPSGMTILVKHAFSFSLQRTLLEGKTDLITRKSLFIRDRSSSICYGKPQPEGSKDPNTRLESKPRFAKLKSPCSFFHCAASTMKPRKWAVVFSVPQDPFSSSLPTSAFRNPFPFSILSCRDLKASAYPRGKVNLQSDPSRGHWLSESYLSFWNEKFCCSEIQTSEPWSCFYDKEWTCIARTGPKKNIVLFH